MNTQSTVSVPPPSPIYLRSLQSLPDSSVDNDVYIHTGENCRNIGKDDVFLCTSIKLEPMAEEEVYQAPNRLWDVHQNFVKVGARYYRPSLGFSCAYYFASRGERIIGVGDELSYNTLKRALGQRADLLVGWISSSPSSREFPRKVRQILNSVSSNWCLHLLYNSGFSSSIPDARFDHFSRIDPEHNNAAVAEYVNPFVYLIQEFLEEFSEGNSFIGVKTALAAQRVEPVLGIDAAVKHNMQGIIRLATKDLQLRGIHFTQIKEGIVDMGFYECAHNAAHNFYIELRHGLAFTRPQPKREYLRERDEKVREILISLIYQDYGCISCPAKCRQCESEIAYVNWFIDNYSIVPPRVSTFDFAKAVYEPTKLFLESRNSPTGKISIPNIVLLPHNQEQSLGF